MTTRRPRSGCASLSSVSCSSVTASRMRAESPAGMSARRASWAPDGEEARRRSPRPLMVASRSSTVRPQYELDAQASDALDLGVERRRAAGGSRDAVAHHAARQRRRLDGSDLVPEAAQMVGGREAARPGADDEHPLARRPARRRRERPALADRAVAQEALDRVDPDGLVELARGCRPSRTGGSRRVPSRRVAGCPAMSWRQAAS